MMARAKATPGVVDAAMLFGVGPLSRSQMGRLVSIPSLNENHTVLTKSITPNYFSVMGMRAISGRLFRPSDESGPPVSIISDAAAREFFPGRDPLGQTIVIEPHRERVLTVVIGIVRGLPISSPEEVPSAELYMLIAQDPSRHDTRMTVLGETLVVRTAGDPHIVERQVVSAIQPVLGDATIHTHVLEDFFRDTTIDRRFASSVLGAVGLLALVIGAIGIYGTVAFLVARQARSIGVRLALGASRGWILRWTLAWALRPVGLGVVLGLVGAWAMSSTFTALLFRVQPADPRVYSAVAMFLLLVGVTAGLVPALRAARIDPIAVLRQE
jgi:hypothetical protein